MRFPVLPFVLLALNAASSPLQAAPLRFEGNTRACAGAVPDEVHQLKLTVRGFAAKQSVHWNFEGVTRHDDQGRALLPPRFWNGKRWTTTLNVKAAANGAVRLRILSGQTAEKPRLVARVNNAVRGQIECDLDAPELLRRFPEPFIDNQNEWRPPDSDNGYLFDYGLAMTGKRENGKIYLKFRVNAKRGDVDGNWRYVNGHQLKIYVAKVSFNENVFRSDGAKVTSLTIEKDIAPYFYIRDPKNPKAKTRIVTTSRDGSASFVMVAGPKYDIQDDNHPQHYVAAQDLSVYYPPLKTPMVKVARVSPQGPSLEWTSAAAQLRGDLLLKAAKRKPQDSLWRIISFDAKGRHEKSFSLGKWSQRGFAVGTPFWAPDGTRFGLTAFGTGNDYMMTFGLFDAKKCTLLKDIAPPYCSWKAFSPDAQKLAFARGSRQVVGSSRVDDDYSLRVWNGKSEVKLPVDSSFLHYDDDAAMVCWRGSNELLVTQAKWSKNANPRPELSVMTVNANGKTPPNLLLARAWKPLASPNGSLIAFYGPESPRQKTSQYYVVAPLDQALCIARRDGKPMRSNKLGYEDRLPLGRFGNAYPALFWCRDSKMLYAASAIYESDAPFVEIWRFNVQSGERQRLASWDFQIPKRTVSNDSNSYGWSFSGLSRDEKTLFATFTQSETNPESVFLLHQWFAVNLSTGTLTKLAINRGTDFAWHSD